MGLKPGRCRLEGWKPAKPGEDGTDDGEMDVRGVADGLEAQCGFVQSFGD